MRVRQTWLLAALCTSLSLQANVITFEDLPFTSGDVENGENLSGSSSTTNDPYGPGSGSLVTKTSTITSGSGGTVGQFANTYSRKYSGADGGGSFEWDSWLQWSYSRVTDNTTPGFGNQYSAKAGGGQGGSSTYAVSYEPVSVSFTADQDLSGGRGLFVTNTTYTYFSMLNGDGFAKQFGGASGNDEDWFLLTIEGKNNSVSTGTATFYLADYRFADNGNDYIVEDWAFVNLSGLGTVDELSFSLSSSDNGAFGMNTPSYFALDSVGAIPEPSVVALALLGGVLALRIFRFRSGS